jgi:hypothetical protein
LRGKEDCVAHDALLVYICVLSFNHICNHDPATYGRARRADCADRFKQALPQTMISATDKLDYREQGQLNEWVIFARLAWNGAGGARGFAVFVL